MGLLDKLDTIKYGGRKEPLMVRTGIDVLDYRNAKRSADKIIPGLDAGNYTLIIGRSSSGKSTLAIQIANHIAKSFNTEVFHFDFERATSLLRAKNLSEYQDLSDEEFEKKYILYNSDIYQEKVFELMSDIRKAKFNVTEEGKGKKKTKITNEVPEEFLVKNDEGKDTVTPTPMIIDSIVTMYPEEVMSQDTTGEDKMLANRVGKANSEFFQKQLSVIWDANILPLYVNHIRVKIEINAFAKTSALIPFLKQEETLPGKRSNIC